MPVVMKRREQVCDLCSHTSFIQIPSSWNKFLIGELFFMIHFTRSKCSKHLQVKVPYIDFTYEYINCMFGPKHWFTVGTQSLLFYYPGPENEPSWNPLWISGNGQDPNSYIYIYACKGNKYPGIPTTIKTMDVNITTIDYLRVLIIKIGSTIILMVVENLFVPCSGYVVFLLPASPEGKVKGCHETQETSSSQIGFGSRREKHQNLPKTVLFQQQNPTTS